MIDTLPNTCSLAQIRRLHPKAPVIRWVQKDQLWYVFHRVDAAMNHHTSEAPRPVSAARPVVVGKRSW